MKNVILISLLLLFYSCNKPTEDHYVPMFTSYHNGTVFLNVTDENNNSLNASFLKEINTYGELSKQKYVSFGYDEKQELFYLNLEYPNAKAPIAFEKLGDNGEVAYVKTKTYLHIQNQKFTLESTFKCYRVTIPDFVGGNSVRILEVKVGDKVFVNNLEDINHKVIIPFIYQNGKISVK